ncbi:MAG TPA: efflux RND transporter permease subunit [Polyangia bacterium]
MWIVKLALRRPYTIAVMALLLVVMGVLSTTRMVVDIFPAIDIPVVAVVWNYPGLSAEDMERRVVLISERAYSSTVDGIQRIESQSIPGIGLLKIYFQPDADIGGAIAQISSVSSTILRITPPGMQPPNVIRFNASNLPVAQLTMSSDTLPEQQIFDYGLNFIRVRLFTIPGLSTPAPFGGKSRQINVDIDPHLLNARGLSPADVVNALQASNVILPAGTARIGSREYNVLTNGSPRAVSEFAAIPVKVADGTPVLLGDVARISDGFADQTNVVRVDGRRASYLAILRHAQASTLAVVDAVKEALPEIKAVAPEGLDLKINFDQSLFVRGAIWSVLREAIISSLLVSLMIGAFLGSWRSMVVVCTSIPLAIFAALIGLKLSGHTINIMTLGGLALAIGMLVDDATVEVENIHRNRSMGKPLTVAILDGASQIAVPAIVATLSICIVFFPVVLLVGPARFLFTPLALAVVLAMLASYLLSRTLVPTLCRFLMAGEHHGPGASGHVDQGATDHPASRWRGIAARMNEARERGFARFQNLYGRMLERVLAHKTFSMLAGGVFMLVSLALVPTVGFDFFPQVDAGLMKLHFRAPVGTRIEETEKMVAKLEDRIRAIIPASELEALNAMIGIPISYNLAFVQTDNIGSMDAELRVSLRPNHQPTEHYMRRIRQVVATDFPGAIAYFQPADIVSQVLNFGVSAPIDVQIEAADFRKSLPLARRLQSEMALIPGIADVHLIQVLDYPGLMVNVDRQRAAYVGVTERDVSNSLLTSLSSSSLVAPSYFLNPLNNVNYSVVVKTPLPKVSTVADLMTTPVTPGGAGAVLQPASASAPSAEQEASAVMLSGVAELRPTATPNQITHFTVQRVLDVAANAQGRDLGGVVHDIEARIAGLGKLSPGVKITVRGQSEVMNESFRSLGLGLILATLLVYFLMVVLFQSWLDPLIIMVAIPGAFSGILWMLALTHTTLNVESFMGTIMSVGIAVANSILLVSFANDHRVEHGIDAKVTPLGAALEAGKTRLRPVLMTALAMIIGMIPMALGLGDAGEQNAPLGRAVIGGLLVATFVTLFLVPAVYASLRRKMPTRHLLEAKFQAEARGEIWNPPADAVLAHGAGEASS